jgi:hypothetical protein
MHAAIEVGWFQTFAWRPRGISQLSKVFSSMNKEWYNMAARTLWTADQVSSRLPRVEL